MTNTPNTVKTADLVPGQIIDKGFTQQAVRLVEPSGIFGANGVELWVVETFDSADYHGAKYLSPPDEEFTVTGFARPGTQKRTPTKLGRTMSGMLG
jgi:hypothetical protein